MLNKPDEHKSYQKDQYVMRLLDENVKGVGIFTVADLLLYEANQKFLNYLPAAYQVSETAYGSSIRDFFSEFEGSEDERVWREVVESNHSCYVKEKRSVLEGDRICYLDYTLTPVVIDDQVQLLIVVTDDVTECVMNRKRLCDQANLIQRQNELLCAVVENLNDSIVIYDGDGNVLMCNAEARRTYPHIRTGVSVREVHTGYDSFYENHSTIPSIDLPAHRVQRGERVQNLVMKVKRKDQVCFVEANAVPVFNQENQLMATVVSHHDITRMKEYDEALHKHKELLEIILDNSYDNISVVYKDGNFILSKNNIFKDIPSRFSSIDELHNAVKYYDMNGNEIARERIMPQRVLNGEKIEDEFVMARASGEEYYLLYSGTPIYKDDGSFLYGIGYSRDLTEIVKNQQALQETQEKLLIAEQEKNSVLLECIRLKDEFIYLITHEFRTPLTVIKSAIQTMELKYRDMPDKAVRYLNTIKQNVNRQTRLVNNLLDITKIKSGNIKLNNGNYDVVFLTRSIVDSIQYIAQQKKIKVSFSTELRQKIISIDEEKFERILLNLLSNALKFTPPGRAICIELEEECYRNKGMVSITVQDEGIGIPKDKQSEIFERFGQVNNDTAREAEGTGIGLHLVKLFATAMGGEILLESEVGVGSKFTVMLPALKPKTGTSAPSKVNSFESVNKLIQLEAIELSDVYL